MTRLDHETPGIGVKIPKIFELPPPGCPSGFRGLEPWIPAGKIGVHPREDEGNHYPPLKNPISYVAKFFFLWPYQDGGVAWK